jgi:ABC-type sugar transport system ATPase subunit
MLELVNICKKAGSFSLQHVSFTVEKGDYFMLAGESGSGKTMILELICGLLEADSGSIIINGAEVNQIPIQKRRVGLVYQSQSLFPHLTVFENIAYPLKCRKLRKAEIRERVEQLAAETEILPLLERSTAKLSGGEAQRVAIARTLATQPDVLLLDEPLSFLDVHLKKGLSSLLRKLNRKGQTIVHVTHDYEETMSLANKAAILENGSITQSGTLQEVFSQPRSEFAANFSGFKNFFPGQIIAKGFEEGFKIFSVQDLEINVCTHEEIGSKGFIIIPTALNKITEKPPSTEDDNCFSGTIMDVYPVKFGYDVIIDIGIEVCVEIKHQIFKSLHPEPGKKVWVHFFPGLISFIAKDNNT